MRGTVRLSPAVLERLGGAKVMLDAGAMDVIGALPQRIIEARSSVASRAASSSSPMLLTPHAGELAHLSGSDKSPVLDDPEAAVLDAARRWNAVVALKGATTLIGAPDGSLWRHEGGNIGLATSGSGDVRSGLITGFAARGATIEQASAWEWRCTHMPAARWPRASARLAIRRENLPVKCRRSCKLSCANLSGHDGLNSRLLFSLPIILIIVLTR
jgi:NAD(P)H-hydrate repair Nnr-like enzyme with NAD(P)H-hydrate dehydratase domain